MYCLIASVLKLPIGLLKKKPFLFNWNLETHLERETTVPRDEVAPLASLIGKCLRLDPAERATAEELLNDPWFEGV